MADPTRGGVRRHRHRTAWRDVPQPDVVPYPGNNVALCLGMCGQVIYINRVAQTVAPSCPPSRTPTARMSCDTLRA